MPLCSLRSIFSGKRETRAYTNVDMLSASTSTLIVARLCRPCSLMVWVKFSLIHFKRFSWKWPAGVKSAYVRFGVREMFASDCICLTSSVGVAEAVSRGCGVLFIFTCICSGCFFAKSPIKRNQRDLNQFTFDHWRNSTQQVVATLLRRTKKRRRRTRNKSQQHFNRSRVHVFTRNNK